jgi:hypothetical protein
VVEDAKSWAERSAGLLASSDGGESWSHLSAGLQVDGLPYRLVAEITLSPDFARDGTLFVQAWGPFVLDSSPKGWRSALFRSRDRGASWEAVQAGADHSYRAILGPQLAASGSALLEEENEVLLSPGSHSCSVSVTHDGGSTWSFVRSSGGYGSCSFAGFLDRGGTELLMLTNSQGSFTWTLSRDGGATPQRFSGPPGYAGAERPLPARPRIAPDGSVLSGSRGGLWLLAHGDRSTFGRLPCTVGEDSLMLEALQTSPRTRQGLGCPTEPARSVSAWIRDPSQGQQMMLWLDDGSSYGWELYDRCIGYPKQQSKSADGSELAAARRLAVLAQRFEGGVIVVVPPGDPAGGTYLINQTIWERLPC